MDEPPFIDTDIARSTVLLTRADFDFFLKEHSILQQHLDHDTRFVLLQFLEIGGDHLDLLAGPPHVVPTTEDADDPQQKIAKQNAIFLNEIREKSTTMLSNAQKSIYFANCDSLFLFLPKANKWTLSRSAFGGMVKKISFLCNILSQRDPSSPPHDLIMFANRIPLELIRHLQSTGPSLPSLAHAFSLLIKKSETLLFDEHDHLLFLSSHLPPLLVCFPTLSTFLSLKVMS